MHHLTFSELQTMKLGQAVPFGRRIHLFFCRRCRRELTVTDWELCNEMRKNYIQNEHTVKEKNWKK